MEDKCNHCAYRDECDVQTMFVYGNYQCSYYSPIIEQYKIDEYNVTIYQINIDEEEQSSCDDEYDYDPFI